jgi:RNA polymerase sigma-70 factor (TIGR02960 family)
MREPQTEPGAGPAGERRVNNDLLLSAQSGDGQAFRALVEPYWRELQVHCYRILGSAQDAEDAIQETLLAAWRGIGGYEGRASLRAWLYRIATNRCLNLLRANSRRPDQDVANRSEIPLPEPSRHRAEPSWLEPYPDALITEIRDSTPGPEARYEIRESVSLAFMVALQALPPRQRAVLVLRDVLGFRAAEVASMLTTTETAVASALSRARVTLSEDLPTPDRESAPLPDSPQERLVVETFSRAFEVGDVEAILSILTDDAWLTMPPLPLEYQGLDAIGNFLTSIALRSGTRHSLIPTRANGQPAFGVYRRDPQTPILHAHGLLVLTLTGRRISAVTRFHDNALLAPFGLPRSLRA